MWRVSRNGDIKPTSSDNNKAANFVKRIKLEGETKSSTVEKENRRKKKKKEGKSKKKWGNKFCPEASRSSDRDAEDKREEEKVVGISDVHV